jgi:hypothetical protein
LLIWRLFKGLPAKSLNPERIWEALPLKTTVAFGPEPLKNVPAMRSNEPPMLSFLLLTELSSVGPLIRS